MKQQLIFVYNANSDLFSTVTDFAHKILSPPTYNCALCALTHGSFSVKQQWKSFIQTLPIETVFLHKDAFHKQYKIQGRLPAIFISTDGELKALATAQEIKDCTSLQQLEKLVTEKLQDHDKHHHTNL